MYFYTFSQPKKKEKKRKEKVKSKKLQQCYLFIIDAKT